MLQKTQGKRRLARSCRTTHDAGEGIFELQIDSHEMTSIADFTVIYTQTEVTYYHSDVFALKMIRLILGFAY